MPFLEWNEQLSVNISSIDDQHKELVKMINELHDAACQLESQTDCEQIIERLKDYIKYHFAAEEKLMQQADYPQIDEHMQDHDKFIDRVLDFQFQLQEEKDITQELLDFLKEWLTGHIKGSDKKYVPYLRA